MVRATGAKNQTEMLEMIGLSNSAASTWKRRGTVPDGALAKISQISGASIHWLKTGEGEMREGGKRKAEGSLDRELMIEAIITIGMAENELNIKLSPEKRAELALLLYDDYYAGVDVKPAKVIQLVRLAA